jgi:preprotein translocase subunit SecA
MRLFAPDWIIKWLNGLDTQGESLTAKEGHMAGMFSKSIETAQHRVEQQNYEIRKQLLEYDTVMNKQREIIYGQRKEILEGVSLKEEIIGSIDDAVDGILATYAGEAGQAGEPDVVAITSSLKLKFNIDIAPSQLQNMDSHSIRAALSAGLNKYYLDKELSVGEGLLRHLERMVFLQIIDSKWKDHLYTMDKLREGIRLRAYAQRDPLIEYKREAFQMFTEMCSSIKEEAVETVFKLQPAKEERFRGVFSSVTQQMVHPEATKFQPPAAEGSLEESVESRPVQSTGPKVGRNEPCPCGSGKKYKKCCGK